MESGPQVLTYTVTEVAEMLGVGRDAVYSAIRSGELPCVRLGRLVRIPKGPFHDRFPEMPKNSTPAAAA